MRAQQLSSVSFASPGRVGVPRGLAVAPLAVIGSPAPVSLAVMPRAVVYRAGSRASPAPMSLGLLRNELTDAFSFHQNAISIVVRQVGFVGLVLGQL